MAHLQAFIAIAALGFTCAYRLEDELDTILSSANQGPELPTKIDEWQPNITKWLAREQLGRCIHPELPSKDLTWLSDLQAAAKAAPRPLAAHAQSYARPLAAAGSIGQYIPWHRAVGLTSDRNKAVADSSMDYPASKCQEFNYNADPGKISDPDGCGLFRSSFSRLQSLRTCIVESLEGSSSWHGSAVWKRYRKAAKAIRQARTDGSSYSDNPSRLEKEDLEKNVVIDPLLLKNFEACVAAGTCVILDANRRADEMIKYLSFKDWDWKSAHLKKWVAAKVRHTASVYNETKSAGPLGAIGLAKPQVSRDLGLEDEVVERIVSECFQVSADSFETSEPPKELVTLQRSLVCNPLMFDTVEVPGAPEPPMVNAAGMWDGSLVRKGEKLEVGTLESTPPVCARAAMALAAWPQVHAPKGYSVTGCLLTEQLRWKGCTENEYFNCICVEKCWRQALKRVCELTPGDPGALDGCCGDKGKL